MKKIKLLLLSLLLIGTVGGLIAFKASRSRTICGIEALPGNLCIVQDPPFCTTFLFNASVTVNPNAPAFCTDGFPNGSDCLNRRCHVLAHIQPN